MFNSLVFDTGVGGVTRSGAVYSSATFKRCTGVLISCRPFLVRERALQAGAEPAACVVSSGGELRTVFRVVITR
jgi:hypothetical protein